MMESDSGDNMAAACECGGKMSGMMKVCMQRAKWMPLFPLVIGIVLFLIGYLLSADVVRILWLVLSGLIILMGGIGLIMARRMAASFSRD